MQSLHQRVQVTHCAAHVVSSEIIVPKVEPDVLVVDSSLARQISEPPEESLVDSIAQQDDIVEVVLSDEDGVSFVLYLPVDIQQSRSLAEDVGVPVAREVYLVDQDTDLDRQAKETGTWVRTVTELVRSPASEAASVNCIPGG